MHSDAQPVRAGRARAVSVEVICLAGLALALPLYEAPKNILCALYVVIWVVNRLRLGDAGGRWRGWDTLFLIWIGSGFAVAAGAALDGSQWEGALDPVRYGAVMWCASRAGYRRDQWLWVLGALGASCLIGLIWGYRDLASGHRVWLELHSVGHVNHSAIYLAIITCGALGLLAAYWGRLAPAWRLTGLASCALLAGSLIVMASRGAFGAAAMTAILLAAGWWRRSRAMALVLAIGVGLVGAATVLMRSPVAEKNRVTVEAVGVLSQRDGIWRVAWNEWLRHPVFGVGMDNYSRITRAHFEAESQARGEQFPEGSLIYYPHAHSLLLNTLAERGLAGSLPLAAVLLAWAWSLLRGLPRAEAAPIEWTAWACALSALGISVIAGAANTTLHHEHAILATLMLGFWLDVRRRRQQGPGTVPKAA